MLQSMRDKAKSWVTVVVVAIIAFMMAVTGLETLAPNRNNPTVATVNGEDVTHAQLSQSIEQRRRALIQQMGDQFDPSMIDEKLLKDVVLQSLVDRTLQLQDAKKHGMDVGDQALDSMIVNMPEFQVDGRFDRARFQLLLRNAGMTPSRFKNMWKEEVLLNQLRAGISATEFVTPAEMRRLSALENQTRDIRWLTLAASPVSDKIKPTEEEIKAYYDSHHDAFMTPEQVVVNFIKLDKVALADQVKIDEGDIKQEYQIRVDELKTNGKDSNKVASILIATDANRTDDQAKARADEVLAKLQKGDDFARLAKEYSDDPVTAKKGGDMGVVKPGFYGKAFDSALAKLTVGQLSPVIKTQYGYQILKLVSQEKPVIPTLAQERDDIINTLKARAVEDIYFRKSRELADISFESADLNQPAEKLGLTIETTKAFGRQGGVGIAENQKVVSAAFSDDVLNLGANSEVIELKPGTSVVLRVKSHHQSELQPLEKVASSIVATIKKKETAEQLKQRAEQLITSINASSADKVAKETGLTWEVHKGVKRGQSGIAREVLSKAFNMPHPASGKSNYAFTPLASGDVAVVALSAVHPGEYGDGDKERMKMLSQYIASGNGRNLYSEYLQALKKQGKVKITAKEVEGL